MAISKKSIKAMATRLAKGFTMIELLIVIAVLGILAVAVLAAINPIEQINRGKDTGSRSDAEQLISAVDRYYASKGYYPWTTGASDTNTNTGVGAVGMVELTSVDQVIGDSAVEFLNTLSTGGASELKSSFTNRVVDPGYNFLQIYNDGDVTSSTYVCFTPKSASFREEAWNRCSNTDHTGLDTGIPGDFPPTGCPDTATCAQAGTADAAVDCMICLP